MRKGEIREEDNHGIHGAHGRRKRRKEPRTTRKIRMGIGIDGTVFSRRAGFLPAAFLREKTPGKNPGLLEKRSVRINHELHERCERGRSEKRITTEKTEHTEKEGNGKNPHEERQHGMLLADG
jgi:hypothetical protein